TLTALRIKTLADHGYADAAANPSKFPAGLFHICTGSYDLKAAHVEVDGVYTNKPPGGIAYRCSFRVTEAVHTIERMVDLMAHQLGVDAADFRMKNFIRPEQFPFKSALGWEYDSGNYAGALQLAMKRIGYAELRREQAEKRKRGELMGIGISSFPCDFVPKRAMALPVGWMRISQLSNILRPRMSKCLDGPAPTISVKLEMPMPISSPRFRFSACSRRSSA